MKRFDDFYIKGYSKYALENYSILRLVIYSLASLLLLDLLVVAAVEEKYRGITLILACIGFTALAGMFILNVMILIRKVKNNK